jgi:hypothetical protein
MNRMRQLGSLVHNESTVIRKLSEMLSSIYDTCPNDSKIVLLLAYFVTLYVCMYVCMYKGGP